MPTNSTQNETASWVTPVAGGGFGLLGLFFILVFASWAIRFSAREARRNNPQRVLTDPYFDQLDELEKAAKNKRRLWRRVLRRLYKCAWSLVDRMTAGHWPGEKSPTDNVDPPARPRLRLLLEATGDSANANSPVEFVLLPRGYRLLPRPKDATSMGRILEALKIKGSDK
ncbi:unnamed protein product [Penicillium glandicola]